MQRSVASRYTRYITRKSTPLSVRLHQHAYSYVQAEATRTRRSKGAVVAELAEEAARARVFPGIGFRDGPTGRRAWLEGTALDVWQVIAAYHDLGSLERLIQETDVTEPQARLCLGYYDRFGDEIDQLIALARRPLADLRREYPFIEVLADSG